MSFLMFIFKCLTIVEYDPVLSNYIVYHIELLRDWIVFIYVDQIHGQTIPMVKLGQCVPWIQ